MSQVVFDKIRFLNSLADDEELARELLTAFLEDCPKRVASLQQALTEGDADGSAKLAHSLKGMCGVVRVNLLSELALNMEHACRDVRLDDAREQFSLFLEVLDQAVVQMSDYMAS